MSPFNRGFTLVEMAIVIVLIGLLLSGVLVGRDLIEAAQIRRVVGEVEKINTAIYTFKNKFNALPGDIPSRIALNNGLTAYIVNPGDTDFLGLGDGDGIIAPRNAKCCAGEQALFLYSLMKQNY
ncbi:MAG: prepilin-type N-terminal cleavage/methylation domain-containing protein [Rickettsiales bacterium]|jgi:prepilin-type N-terminal cleavage/methylation domain-containing protein|nr:prepilin-type N-terminal cleavage/methylation domain-containing protein [Rickettsiales bacterium]